MKHREVARGAVWNGIGYTVGGVLAVAYPVLLLKWLGRSDYGVVSYLALLVNQSYLLSIGIGEAMAQRMTAARSQGKIDEAIAIARSALLGIWLISLGLSVLWELSGIQLLASLLSLTESERTTLSGVHLWVHPGIWGIQTGMLLGWMPVALGRFRWAALNTVLQAIWQGAFPLIVLFFSQEKKPVLALQSILLGYFLYGLSIWLLAIRGVRAPLLPGSPRLLLLLLKSGFWSTLRALISLPYQFLERTLIARWASLSLMGFYSAVHVLLSRLSTLTAKGMEALFPVFGSVVDSPTRQALRLGQSVWFISLAGGVLGLWGWAALTLLQLFLPVRIEAPERMIIAAGIAGLVLYLPVVPVSTFYQSRGAFRFFFWISVPVLSLQLLTTPLFVQKGLFFFPGLVGALAWMGLYSGFLLQQRHSGALWRRWVVPTYLKLGTVMGVAMIAYIRMPGMLPQPAAHAVVSVVLLLLSTAFLAWDLRGRLTYGKRQLIRQLADSLWGLAMSARRRFFRPLREAALNDR